MGNAEEHAIGPIVSDGVRNICQAGIGGSENVSLVLKVGLVSVIEDNWVYDHSGHTEESKEVVDLDVDCVIEVVGAIASQFKSRSDLDIVVIGHTVLQLQPSNHRPHVQTIQIG